MKYVDECLRVSVCCGVQKKAFQTAAQRHPGSAPRSADTTALPVHSATTTVPTSTLSTSPTAISTTHTTTSTSLSTTLPCETAVRLSAEILPVKLRTRTILSCLSCTAGHCMHARTYLIWHCSCPPSKVKKTTKRAQLIFRGRV